MSRCVAPLKCLLLLPQNHVKIFWQALQFVATSRRVNVCVPLVCDRVDVKMPFIFFFNLNRVLSRVSPEKQFFWKWVDKLPYISIMSHDIGPFHNLVYRNPTILYLRQSPKIHFHLTFITNFNIAIFYNRSLISCSHIGLLTLHIIKCNSIACFGLKRKIAHAYLEVWVDCCPVVNLFEGDG